MILKVKPDNDAIIAVFVYCIYWFILEGRSFKKSLKKVYSSLLFCSGLFDPIHLLLSYKNI